MPSIDRKKDKKRRAVESDSDGEGSEAGGVGGRNDATLAKVDPEYLNQPVDLKQGGAKLSALIAQLKVTEKSLKEVGKVLAEVANETAESLSAQHANDSLDEDALLKVYFEDPSLSGLDREYRSTLDRKNELEIRMNIISDIRQRILQGHQITDINKMYQDRVAAPLDEYARQTPRQRFLGHKRYKEFVDYVWESLSDGGGVPNIKRFLPREDGDEDDSDDELEIGAQQHSFQCPITLTDLEDPYSSTVCPHAFSGEAIKELLQQNHGTVDCPVSGCPKKLNLATIERDDGLRRRVEAHQKRVKEGRVQATQGGGKTYETMDLSDDADDE
ncbi:hypothetical protein JCM10207_002187 [Rhodosporidiobolus poonsookiae]